MASIDNIRIVRCAGEEHCEHLQLVFYTIQQEGLHASVQKSRLGLKKHEYLEFLVGMSFLKLLCMKEASLCELHDPRSEWAWLAAVSHLSLNLRLQSTPPSSYFVVWPPWFLFCLEIRVSSGQEESHRERGVDLLVGL